PESNEYFTSEYENVAEVIKSITNLDEEDFRTIVSTGNSPEIDIVVINSGLEFETVDNIKTASIYSYDTQASMQHFYALIREGYKDIGVIFNLSLVQIEAIIEDAYNYHIIPELGDIEETFEYISNYKIKIELEQTNDDGDSLNDILKSILDEDIL